MAVPIFKMIGVCTPVTEDHHAQPPEERLCHGAGGEAQVNC